MANVPNTQINPLYNNALPKPTPVSQVVSPITAPSTTNTALIPRDIGTIPRVGTSIIAPNPVATIPRTPITVVPTFSTPAVMSATIVDAYTSRPIVLATPNVVSNAVKELAGSFKGGGGGGGSASSEEGEKEGDIEEPKKPNYLLLGLLGVGAYFLFKKLK